MNNSKKAFRALTAEFFFILLPFILSVIVFSYKGQYIKMIQMPEWSLAAAVLFGQSLTKFISGMLSNDGTYKPYWESVALGVSSIIIIGLAPSLIVLTLIISESVSDNNQGVVSSWLTILQVLLFALGVTTFFIFGLVGEYLLRSKSE